MIKPPDLLPVAGVLLALALPLRRFGRGVAGAVFTALGLASLRVAGGPAWESAGLPSTYLSVTAALLVAGMSTPLAQAGLAAWHGELRERWPWVLSAAIALLVSGAATAASLAHAAGVGATILALTILSGAAVLLRTLAPVLRLGEAIRRLDRAVFRAHRLSDPLDWDPTARWLLFGHCGLAVVALMAPHLILLLGAVFGSAIAGVVLDRRLDHSARWPRSVPAGLVVLAAASALLIRVAGPMPLTLRELRDGPFSPAFELVASLLFIAGSWPLFKLWPVHSRLRGPATPVAAAALLVRLVAPVLPGGTGHWQPLVFPLLVVSSWYAAGTGSASLSLTAVAVAGMLSLRPEAAAAGVVVAALVAVLGLVCRLRPPKQVRRTGMAGIALAAGAAAIPLLEGALRAQTVYTVLLAAGLAATLAGIEESSSTSPSTR
jgi:hypothetical protein